MKKIRKGMLLALVLFLATSLVTPVTSMMIPTDVSIVEAASKIKLNKTKVTMNIQEKVKLKIKGTKKKVKWSSSNKKVASVSNKGVVTGNKAGKATITASVGKKKYKCKVTVRKNALINNHYKLYKYVKKYGDRRSSKYPNWYILESDADNRTFSVECFNEDYAYTQYSVVQDSYDGRSRVRVECDVVDFHPYNDDLRCDIEYQYGPEWFTAQAYISRNYTTEQNVYFKTIKTSDSSIFSRQMVNKISNSYLQLTLLGCSIYVLPDTDLWLSDLGLKKF